MKQRRGISAGLNHHRVDVPLRAGYGNPWLLLYSQLEHLLCMPELLYRRACDNDVPAMAEIRSSDWGTPDYWQKRIREYLEHELHPQHALLPRIAFVAVDGQQVAGLIAGHLTRRFGCDGELQWISVRAEYRQRGVATELLRRLAEWFVERRALRICVDVEPANQPARSFYARHGAVELKSHWMHWKDIGAAPLMN